MPQGVKSHKFGGNAPVGSRRALIALGGNVASRVGSPVETLHAALLRLADLGLTIEAASRPYSTPCFPVGSGPDYINSAAAVTGEENPERLLAILHTVEQEFGRERDRRWGRRTLDLDLLAIGERILPDREVFMTWRNLPLDRQMAEAPDRLILPHPRLQDRAFVLIPLAEIAADWTHPILGQSVAEMAAALPKDEKSQVKPL